MKKTPFKVVVFRAGSLGDCLMAKYFLENVRLAHPEARCAIVVGERGAMIRGLLVGYPWIEVREVNRGKLWAAFELMRNFWQSDLVVTQYTKGTFSLLSKIMARLLAKKGAMVGFVDPWWGNRFLYSKLIVADKNLSTREQENQALNAAGIPIGVARLEFVQGEEKSSVFAAKKGRYIIVHLFPGNEGRGFTFENKVVIVSEVARKYGSQYELIITGGLADQKTAEAVVLELRQRDQRLNSVHIEVVAGKTSLPELTSLISGAAGVVSADTGVAHLAAHMSRPLVVLRSCVGRNWWLPGQYSGIPLVLDADQVCIAGHIGKMHPACINAIDFNKIAIPGLSIA